MLIFQNKAVVSDNILYHFKNKHHYKQIITYPPSGKDCSLFEEVRGGQQLSDYKIYVRMQIKRTAGNISNIGNNKQSNLLQPLISIAKASTPVRTRIVPANSTPVNPSKIIYPHRSPANKENLQENQGRFQASRNGLVMEEKRINLSPVLSVNKKMNEGPKPPGKKSLTPQSVKIEEYDSYGLMQNNQADKRYQTLNDSKGFSSTVNFTNMRNSGSFKNLIEARCKTPNRFESNPLTPGSILESKRESVPVLKESLSSNHLFKQFSKPRLSESRSFDKFKPLAQVSSSQSSHINCMNKDGKKAKYRVINDEGDESNDLQLYYCSKCTIPLVQQGFIVEELGREREENNEERVYGDYRGRLEGKKSSIEFILRDIGKRQVESLEQLNRYYDYVQSYIESKRNLEAQRIVEYYNTVKSQPTRIHHEISQAMIALGKNRSIRSNQIQRLLITNEQELIGQPLAQIDFQSLAQRFSQKYQEMISVNLSPPSQQRKQESLSSRNHAMRFSFQKLLTDIHSKKSNVQAMMRPLQEEDESAENDYEGMKEHTAFRDLFPEGEEGQHINSGIHSPTFKAF